MATFVLIHGAWHGGWCWNKVIPLLEKAGHSVIAPDLPGHGQTHRENYEIITLKDYTDFVIEILDKQIQPVILLGHSLGGITISQIAEYRPLKIKKLVYLCAFLLSDGQRLSAERDKALDPLAYSDEVLKDLFYGDCTYSDFLFAKSRLVAQPKLISNTPIHVTEKNFGSIPRVYITCLQDKAIHPAKQRGMYTTMPCERVITMNTSHSPFLSAPEHLVNHLIALV